MAEDGAGEPTVESKLVYEGRILDLRVDTVRLPSGRLTTREIAEHSDSVCMVPLDSQGNVLLVRQYRKSVELNLLEVPAGGIEENEAPEDAVLRELQEEVGYTAGKITRLAGFWVSPGWCTEFMHAYLATELSPARLDADFDENITVIQVPLAQTIDLISSGEIQDGKSVASLLLAMRHLEDN
ncbi:MAG: NUDIX hydrolase [Dehalococcoidia bacterium]